MLIVSTYILFCVHVYHICLCTFCNLCLIFLFLCLSLFYGIVPDWFVYEMTTADIGYLFGFIDT